MTKQSKSIFGILTESVGLYFSAFDKFLKYMTYPVLGQIAGLGIIFFITYFYSQNVSKLIDKYPNLNSLATLAVISVLIILPGLLIFCNAFWKYLIAYGALNSMFENLQKSKKVYDFEAHNELVTRKTFSFLCIWLIWGIFSILAICPLLWIICGIFAVYFVLVFQIFTFEPELSPIGCFKKSLILIKGHFVQTFILLCLIALITYYIIPQIILTGFDATGISTALSKLIIPFASLFPELNLTQYGLSITHFDIASFIIQTTVAQIIIQYTLPMRSMLWSNWYKELNNGITSINLPTVTKRKKSKKRPSEKLMEESHKKYSKKKIDENILKRAMEKDDEE